MDHKVRRVADDPVEAAVEPEGVIPAQARDLDEWARRHAAGCPVHPSHGYGRTKLPHDSTQTPARGKIAEARTKWQADYVAAMEGELAKTRRIAFDDQLLPYTRFLQRYGELDKKPLSTAVRFTDEKLKKTEVAARIHIATVDTSRRHRQELCAEHSCKAMQDTARADRRSVLWARKDAVKDMKAVGFVQLLSA